MNLEVIKVTQTHRICRLPPVTRIDRCLQILRESFVGFLLNANMLEKSVGMIKYTCESRVSLFYKVKKTCCVLYYSSTTTVLLPILTVIIIMIFRMSTFQSVDNSHPSATHEQPVFYHIYECTNASPFLILIKPLAHESILPAMQHEVLSWYLWRWHRRNPLSPFFSCSTSKLQSFCSRGRPTLMYAFKFCHILFHDAYWRYAALRTHSHSKSIWPLLLRNKVPNRLCTYCIHTVSLKIEYP